MPIPWLTVLQAVPWSDVIVNAPKVAEGAKKLWNTVAKKPPPTPAEPADEEPTPEAQALASLNARVAALEAGQAELHQQMLASSELIKALADQNAQLIRRLDEQRRQLRALGALSLALVAIAAASAAWLMQRGGTL